MTLSLPHNCRFDEKENGVAFDVAIGDRIVKCFITSQALENHFGPCADIGDKVHVVSTTTSITRKVRNRVAAGDSEPVTLTSLMFQQ